MSSHDFRASIPYALNSLARDRTAELGCGRETRGLAVKIRNDHLCGYVDFSVLARHVGRLSLFEPLSLSPISAP